MILTFLTYNLADGLAPPDQVVRFLRHSGADVIGLQEVAEPQADAIAWGLRASYPYQVLHPFGIAGKGLLSRFPVRQPTLLPLFPHRPDIAAIVEAPGGSFQAIVAHPPPPRYRGTQRLSHNAARHAQIDALLAVALRGGPTVLLGDFNLTDRHWVHRRLRAAGLIDAFSVAGRGPGATLPTYVARWAQVSNPLGRLPLIPVLRVDYIWHTSHFRTLAAWRGEHAGSDHLPVFTRLALQRHAGLEQGAIGTPFRAQRRPDPALLTGLRSARWWKRLEDHAGRRGQWPVPIWEPDTALAAQDGRDERPSGADRD